MRSRSAYRTNQNPTDVTKIRATSWKENLDANGTAPYGIRWGRSPKGSTIHVMTYSKYSKSFYPRCGRGGSSGQATVLNANVYLKAKPCKSCTNWMPLAGGLQTAYKADWEYFTDPATGRTKRERHN